MDCLFCKIANKKIPAEILFENDHVIAFEDISPQAPIHFLVIPKKHISTANNIDSDDAGLIGELFLAAKAVASQKGIAEDGFRLTMNCNEQGGQTVYHIHLHVLGGRQMTWPPG